MVQTGWLERVSIDWSDFPTASRISADIVQELAADRGELRRMVLATRDDEHLRSLAEKHEELNYIVLYDALDRGLRIRLHRFSQGLEDIPHNHRFSFSSALLGGSYVHSLFQVQSRQEQIGGEPWALDQPEGSAIATEFDDDIKLNGLAPQYETIQAAGSSYTLHHSTVHKTAMPVEDAYSVFCRSPAAKPCALQLMPETRTYRWKFGRANETEQVVADRRMTATEFDVYIEHLEAADVI